MKTKDLALKAKKIDLLKKRTIARMRRLENMRHALLVRFLDAVTRRKVAAARKKLDDHGRS